MRHARVFAVVTLSALVAAGCQMESSSGSSTLNPATDVNVTFSSFELNQQPETFLFTDLILAIEPDANAPEASEARQQAAAIRAEIARFAGLSYNQESPSQISSVRNPLDLIHRVIGANEIQNFTEARQYMVQRIQAGEAGEYNNRTNQVSIRFTDLKAFEEGKALQDYEWKYPIAKWVYTPDSSNRVTRVLTWVASGSFADNTTRPSATLATQFAPESFRASGYNELGRLYTEGTLVIEGEREMSFARQYEGLNSDTLIIDGTKLGTANDTAGGPVFEFNNQAVDCLKIEMDYSAPELRIFRSLDEPPTSPDYCSKKATPDARYATRVTGLRA